MIKLELNDKTILRFNLKTYKREKALRSAWYSMHDTPKYSGNVLKMVTDRGETHSYKVSEIASCEFIEKKFEYIEPSKTVAVRKKWENAVTPKSSVDSQLEQLVEMIYEFLGKLFEGVSTDIKSNAMKFLDTLKQNNVPLDPNDDFLRKMVLESMQAPEDRVPFFVSLYTQYYQANNK